MSDTNFTSGESDESDIEIMGAGAIAGWYVNTYMTKQPQHNSILTGELYVEEVINGNPNRFRGVCRMEKNTFARLCKVIRERLLLSEGRKVKIEEQVMIFLYTMGEGNSNRNVSERFQHSYETTSRYFNKVLDTIVALSSIYIKLPSTDIPQEISEKPQYTQFKDCIGAIDGTHIVASVPVDEHIPYRNRKGFLSQNVMAACSFDLRFTFILAGWEGSAADSTVLHAAFNDSLFRVPEGKYYLVDAGYGLTPKFITPYRSVRYHLKEYGPENSAPRDSKELFNLRHASLRNAIERIFGVLKKRFKILTSMPSFKFTEQVKIVIAACTLHNFILHCNGGVDHLYERYDSRLHQEGYTRDPVRVGVVGTSSEDDYIAGKLVRDTLAMQMWNDYVRNRRTGA